MKPPGNEQDLNTISRFCLRILLGCHYNMKYGTDNIVIYCSMIMARSIHFKVDCIPESEWN